MMQCVAGNTCIYPFGTRAVSSLLLRSTRVAKSARPREATPIHAAQTPLTQDGSDTSVATEFSVPSLVEDVAVTSFPLKAETLIEESFGQTEYVEKDAVELSNVVPAAPLRHAEVVPDSPSFSLVRIAQPIVKRNQSQSILAEILAIAIPALGTVMADPFMSLVDTAFVGQISAIQLAALGPNTAIFNMIFAVFSFMGAALANRLARNSLKAPGITIDEKTKRREQNEKVLCDTLVLAVTLGAAVTGSLLAFGPTLLHAMGTSPEVMASALDYLRVRAMATPAMLFSAVSQGACLGQQDMWTPMKVMFVAGIVNLMGDMALIMGLGMGTFGAAAATAVSQIAGAVFFFSYLRRGGANGKSLRLKWNGLPTLATLEPILQMGRILTCRSVLLISAYTAMTTVATTMGTLTLAAHQVTLQFFWLLATCAEPLSLTAQSILARDQQNRARIHKASHVLLHFGATAGLALSALFGVTLAFFGRCFTSDLSVIAAFQTVIPHGMLSLFLVSVAVTLDGICIGTNQLGHLPKIIAASTAAAWGYLWITCRLNLGLTGVWASMIIFYSSRVVLHAAHNIRARSLSPMVSLTPTNLRLQVAN